ncbi:MAG: HIT family protein [Nanoarchaeota archaeon]|nr:HIT family protein [Nanoarchaeota archaeon]MBU1632839.1 HIT family protein [Nanoarchaeota archaeon]MBU1876014.1 HIT family protein [Nanoarchaeota archaeon]
MKCEYCDIVDRKSRLQILYEDNDLIVAVKDTVLTPGQVTIFPRQHFTIMEMVPENILEKCFILANKVGAAIFDSLECQGTNIIVQNGLSAGQKVPHFALEVIPRRDGDNLNFQWQPKELAEDEVELVYQMLKEEVGKIVKSKDGKKGKVKEVEEVVVKDEKTLMKMQKEDEKNYLLKSLRRIP